MMTFIRYRQLLSFNFILFGNFTRNYYPKIKTLGNAEEGKIQCQGQPLFHSSIHQKNISHTHKNIALSGETTACHENGNFKMRFKKKSGFLQPF